MIAKTDAPREFDHAVNNILEAFKDCLRPDLDISPSGPISWDSVNHFQTTDWENADIEDYNKSSEVITMLSREMYTYLVPHWFRIMKEPLEAGDDRGGNVHIFSFNSGYADGRHVSYLFKLDSTKRNAIADALDTLERSYFYASSKGQICDLSRRLRE